MHAVMFGRNNMATAKSRTETDKMSKFSTENVKMTRSKNEETFFSLQEMEMNIRGLAAGSGREVKTYAIG